MGSEKNWAPIERMFLIGPRIKECYWADCQTVRSSWYRGHVGFHPKFEFLMGLKATQC